MKRLLLGIALVGVASAAQAQTFPSESSWVAVTRGGAIITDALGDVAGVGKGPIDLVGSSSSPAAQYYSDGTYLYLRMKVDSNPISGGSFSNFGWGVQISTDGSASGWEYAALLNGETDSVQVHESPSPSAPLDALRPFSHSYGAATNAHSVAVGSDFFVDLAIPLSDLGTFTTLQFVFGTNTSHNSAFTTGSAGDIAGLGFASSPSWASAASDVVTLANPIPEPETYAMLLAGLSLLGFEARRRRKLHRAG